MKRIVSIALFLAMLLSMAGMISVSASTQTEIFSVAALEQYAVYSEVLESDNHMGIPVGIKTYIKDPAATTAETPLILYVVNTQTANVGRGEDETILSGMLDRGYVVVVLDYFNHEATATDELDWSIQQLRLTYANKGSYSAGALHDHYSYVIPQGYDLKRNIPFWSADEHGANGTIEHIIQSWNTDFLGVRGNKVITFAQDTVISGITFTAGQSMTVAEYTASLPEGKVTSIFQCIGPDGKMVDMDVRMDLIYPVDPKEDVPVMLYASSGDFTMDTWNMTNRPHLTGFLMDGYAAACYEHPYVPMGKGDHYGYYDGSTGINGSVGAVTGDSFNGSLYAYNGIKINTAAMRMVRYVAEEYGFDPERVGVTGISKTGNVLKLGHPDPETLPENRIYDGQTGKTRYEEGFTDDVVGATGTLRGGKEQPWLTYPGTDTEIPSNAQFVFCAVGGGQETITPDHAPIYICGTMLPSGSYYGFYPYVMSYCLSNDVPVMDYVCENVGHEFGFGNDRETGNSVYTALFECANYYLLGGQARCEYIKPLNGTDYVDPTADITVKFNAGVALSQVTEKVTVVNNATGKKVSGVWTAAYGDTLYTFTPFNMEGGYSYTVTVPNTILAKNGKALKSTVQATFTAARSKGEALSLVGNSTLSYGNDLLIPFTGLDDASVRTQLRFSVMNDAANVVQVYAAKAEENGAYTIAETPLGEVNLNGAGVYSFDLTPFMDSLDESTAFCLRTKKQAGESVVANIDLEDLSDGDPMNAVFGSYAGTYAKVSISDDLASLGKGNSIKFAGFRPQEYENYHQYYQTHTNVFIYQLGIKSTDLTAEDYGRRFRLTFSVYDTTSRNFNIQVGRDTMGVQGSDIDFGAEKGTFTTQAGKWTDYQFAYSVNSPLQYTTLQKKNIVLMAEAGGADMEDHPMYVDDYKIVEITTDVQIGTATLATTPVQIQTLTPTDIAYVENGDNADVELPVTDGALVSGQTLKLLDAQKTYIKLPLENYAGGPLTFSFDTEDGSNGRLCVYGVNDVAADWSSETIHYLNAPANDRLGNGVDLTQVYGQRALGEIVVDGAQTCTVDLTNFARSMKARGAEDLTLILTMEGKRETVTLTEDFEDSDMVRIAGSSAGLGSTDKQDHTTGKGHSCAMTPSQYTYERMLLLLLGQKDAVAVGQRYRITFWAMANATGNFRICVIPKGKTINYAPQACPVTAENQWQQYTYEFILTEEMLTGDPYISFSMNEFGTLGTKTLFVDDFTVERIGLNQVNLVPNFTTQSDKLVSLETFDDWTTGQAAWSVHEDTYTGKDAYYQYGFNSTTTGRDIVETEDATSGEGKSFKFIPNSSGCKVKFYGILDSLTEADIGRTLTVSFKVKIPALPAGKSSLKFQYGMISGLYRLGSETNGLTGEVADAADYQVNYYQKHETTVTEDDVGKWLNCTFDITVDANMLPRAAALNSSRPKDYEAGLGMLGIGSTDIRSGALDLTMYIDDIMVTEASADEETELETPFTYTQRFEAVTDANLADYGKITSYSTAYLSADATSKKAIDTLTVTNEDAYSGTTALKMVAHTYNNGYRFNNCFQLKLGAQYTVSFRLKANKAGDLWVALCGSNNTLYHNGRSGTYGKVTIAEADVDKWVQYSYTFTVDQTMIDSNICYFIIRAGLLRNQTTIVTDSIDGKDVYNPEKSSPLVMYFDDLRSEELVSGGSQEEILPTEAITLSADGPADTAFLSIQANGKNPLPQGIRKTYITFASKEDYRYAERAILNLTVSEANGQILNIYGLKDLSYPETLTYHTAPGNTEDESVRPGNQYGGKPLQQIHLSGAGIYQVDITDYVRNYQAEELLLVLTTTDPGSTEYLHLDFETFGMSADVDYQADGTVSAENGKLTVSGDGIKLLNDLTNAVDATASVKVTAVNAGTVTVTVGENSVTETFAAGQTKLLQVACNGADGVQVSATTGGFALEDVVVADSTVIVLPEVSLDVSVAEKPVPTLTFAGAALELQNNLAIRYRVRNNFFTNGGFANPYVVFTLNGVETVVSDYTVSGGDYIFTFSNIAPNQMNDTITATLCATFDGVEHSSAPRNYSVAEYCYTQLSKYSADAYAELRTLLVDLLNYGAVSQQYTGYHTDDLVNADLTETQKGWATQTDRTYNNIRTTKYETIENPTVAWKGGSLVLKDAVVMRFRFETDNTDGLSFKITSGGKTWWIDEISTEGGMTYIYFNGLNAGQMSDEVFITAYQNGAVVSNTVRYSVESYAAEKITDTEIPYLAEIVDAMMKYGDSAYAYVH